MALALQPLFQRLARYAPMIAALIIAGGVTVVLAYLVLPAQSQDDDNPNPPNRPTISAPTVVSTLPAEPTSTPEPAEATSEPTEVRDVAEFIETPDGPTATARVIKT